MCGCFDHLENDCKKMIDKELYDEKVYKNYDADLRSNGIQI